MNIRSVVASPPAVAGLVALVLVIGAVFGVRASLNNGSGADGTDVAGEVIERSEAPEASEPAPLRTPAILRDRDRTREPRRQQTEAPVAPAPAPAPVEAPAEPQTGLIRDPDAGVIVPDEPADTDNTDNTGNGNGNGNGNGGDGDGGTDPKPSDKPTTDPKPSPEPTDSPSPDPEPNENRFALHTGDGHSEWTAYSDAGEWTFSLVQGHSGGRSETSRSAGTRLTVGFTQQSMTGNSPDRFLQCAAVLNAGNRRLTTDTEHAFEVSLLRLDANGVPVTNDPVNTVTARQAYDLEAGEDTAGAPIETGKVFVDASTDDTDYTCGVRYYEL